MNQTPHPATPGTAVSDDEIQAMQDQVAYWETYVMQAQRQREEAAALVQATMDESGLSARGINPADPVFAEIALDLALQKQLSLQYRLKLDQAQPVDPLQPDVSRSRQRTSAPKV